MVLLSRRKNAGANNSRFSFTSLAIFCAVVATIAVLASLLLQADSSSYYLQYYASLSQQQQSSSTSSSSSITGVLDKKNSVVDQLLALNPLGVPPGQAENLPSVRVADKQEGAVDDKRKFYGGNGDKKHLGGFTELDLAGVSPAVWRQMLTEFGVHSVLDVGCGRGTSTSWFALHGCKVLCAEGSHDAIEKSMLPDVVDAKEAIIVEHDFSRGPWWPAETYDAVWAVEFLEHVGVQFQYNYITAFRKAALLFVTSSRWGGWHHVEVHPDDWWIRKYEAYGFRYDEKLTQSVRKTAQLEASKGNETAPNGKKYNAQHIWLSMKVFVNPVVAALPQHAHLFPEHGCFGGRNEKIIPRICGEGKDGDLETPLPKSFWPLVPTAEQDKAWAALVQKHITTN